MSAGFCKRKLLSPAEESGARSASPEKEPASADELFGKLDVVPRTNPFTRWKTAEVILSALAAVLGLMYLLPDPKWIPLDVLLPCYCVIAFAILPLRWKDASALGLTGAARFFSVLLWGVIALLVAAATAVYFVWY